MTSLQWATLMHCVVRPEITLDQLQILEAKDSMNLSLELISTHLRIWDSLLPGMGMATEFP
jgi:hypothetical protein